MRRLRSALALTLIAGTGCSLFVDLSGLTGAGGASDASSDGALDANAALDGASLDGQSLDGAIADGAGVRYCATQGPLHSFCADFDEPDADITVAWDASWTSLDITSGTVALDETSPKSPPHSLMTSIDPNEAGTVTYHADIYRSFGPPAPSKIDCSFDFRFDRGVGGTGIGAADLMFDNFGVELGLLPDGTIRLFDPDAAHDVGTVVKGQWVRVDIVLERLPVPSASVSLDGKLLLQYAPQSIPATVSIARAMLGFEGETGQQDGWQYGYDNYTCDVQ